jgi:hypothetical protein
MRLSFEKGCYSVPRLQPMTRAAGSVPTTPCSTHGSGFPYLGYFREEFVARRRWLDDLRYADMVALGQFLPRPVSLLPDLLFLLPRGIG